MKKVLFILFILPFISFAQDEERVNKKYAELGVKEQILSDEVKLIYDQKGRLIHQVELLAEPIDTVYYKYDTLNNLTHRVSNVFWAEDSSYIKIEKSEYKYDSLGNITEKLNVFYDSELLLQRENYKYDSNGKLIETLYYDNEFWGSTHERIYLDSMLLREIEYFRYDSAQNLVLERKQYRKDSIKYFYNNSGYLIKKIERPDHRRGCSYLSSDKIKHTTEYLYHDDLKVKEIETTFNHENVPVFRNVIDYKYNKKNLIKSRSIKYYKMENSVLRLQNEFVFRHKYKFY